jgi:ribosome recycling factor
MEVSDVMADVKAQMNKAIEHFEYELSKIRAGKPARNCE